MLKIFYQSDIINISDFIEMKDKNEEFILWYHAK